MKDEPQERHRIYGFDSLHRACMLWASFHWSRRVSIDGRLTMKKCNHPDEKVASESLLSALTMNTIVKQRCQCGAYRTLADDLPGNWHLPEKKKVDKKRR